MKRTICFLLTIVFALACAYGQEDTSPEGVAREKKFQEEAAKGQDTTKKMGWNYSLISGLNLTQAAFRDWASGGEDALAYAINTLGTAEHVAEHTQWSNQLKMVFGQSRLGNKSLRKTDDEIYFESLLIYRIWEKINPYASFTLRSQFAPGFVYTDTSSTQTSAFFDPGYLTQSVGMAYQPSSMFTTRLGVGMREVVTSRYPVYADDPETIEIEKTSVEGGLESITTLDWPFAENMTLNSRLELFSPFSTPDEIIVRFDNIVAAKVNKYIVVTFNLQLVNDVTVTRRTQVKETLALGFSYNIL